MALDGQAKCDLDVVKVNFKVALVSSNFFAERINELKQQVQYEEKIWLQTQGKLQTTEVDCLLCDAKVVECEELYANFVMGLKLAQELLTKLIE